MMRRLFVLACAGALAAAVFSSSALGTHGGAEELAAGRGSVTSEGTTYREIIAVCLVPGPQIVVVGRTTVHRVLTQRFDFNARLTTEEAEDVLLSEPHGQMRIAYRFVSTFTTEYQVPPGCFLLSTPIPSQVLDLQATATAEVTCLTVVNNRAAIGGRITRFEGNFPPTRGLVFNVADNTVARQQLVDDEFAHALFVAEAPQECAAPTPGLPITSGDIRVEQS